MRAPPLLWNTEDAVLLDHPRWRSDVLAPLAAESVFVSFAVLVSVARGLDPCNFIRMPAAFILGPDEVIPPAFIAVDVMVGSFMHLLVTVGAGLLYAAVVSKMESRP